MSVSKIFKICNAYESGYGHGLDQDGLDKDYYSDPELNEAYKIGYDAGFKETHEEEVELLKTPPEPVGEAGANDRCVCDNPVFQSITHKCLLCGKYRTA